MSYSGSSSDSGRGVRSGPGSRSDIRVKGYRPRSSGGSMPRSLAIILVIALVVVGAGLFFGMPVVRGFAAGIADGNQSAINLPFFGDMVRDELGTSLIQPGGTDATPIPFQVASGESTRQIGVDLTSAKLISRPLVFQYLVVSQGVGNKLQTGTFNLNQTMTPQQIVERLQQAPEPPAQQVQFAPKVSLRLEQIAALLQTLDLNMDVNEWYQEVTNPPDQLRTDYPWLSTLPEGRSLEGYLGIGVVYELDRDVTPDQLVHMMLDQWQKTIGQPVIDEAQQKNKDFYQLLTLASIVERETGNDDEKAKVAGVYANRLKGLLGNKLLQADPTVIYANDTMKLKDLPFADWHTYFFWDLLGISDLTNFQVSSNLQGYQTYVNQGLPPGPIDSPQKASIEAALNPDTADGNLFFYACPNSKNNKLRFATSLAQQQKNISKCQSQN